jgi:hypothetical protein
MRRKKSRVKSRKLKVEFKFDERSLATIASLKKRGIKFTEVALIDKTILIPKRRSAR